MTRVAGMTSMTSMTGMTSMTRVVGMTARVNVVCATGAISVVRVAGVFSADGMIRVAGVIEVAFIHAHRIYPSGVLSGSIASGIFDDRSHVLSTHAVQEFYVRATRATRADRLDQRQASALVESFTRFTVPDITLGVVRAALDTRQRFGLSYWDSAIIEAARTTGETTVLSEDLSHGTDYNGVKVIGPFA